MTFKPRFCWIEHCFESIGHWAFACGPFYSLISNCCASFVFNFTVPFYKIFLFLFLFSNFVFIVHSSCGSLGWLNFNCQHEYHFLYFLDFLFCFHVRNMIWDRWFDFRSFIKKRPHKEKQRLYSKVFHWIRYWHMLNGIGC